MNIRWLLDKVECANAGFPRETFTEKRRIYTCVNPFKYHIVRKNPEIFGVMDGIFVDGILMCKMIRLLWGRKIERLSFDMTAMAPYLFGRLNRTKETVYLIGDREGMASKAAQIFRNAYPGMHIAGTRNGFFKDPDERQREIRYIAALNPDFVLVGMGGLIQEQFAIDLKAAGYGGIVFTCGGFFHQSTEKLNYYPEWVDRYNLRMPYRRYKERDFKRLWHIMVTFPVQFALDSLATVLSHK